MSETSVESKEFSVLYGISPIAKEHEWAITVVGSKEFCVKVAEYIKQLRSERSDK